MKEQPLVARVLHDKSFNFKTLNYPTLTCLDLFELVKPDIKETFTDIAEPQQEHFKLLTDDE